MLYFQQLFIFFSLFSVGTRDDKDGNGNEEGGGR